MVAGAVRPRISFSESNSVLLGSPVCARPSATADQVKVIQTLLRDLNFSREAPDGVLGPATRSAIRDYERSLGIAQTGEPSKTLFDSLKEMRGLTAPAPVIKSE